MNIAMHPAQLIIGTSELLRNHTEQLMQQHFCPNAKTMATDVGCFCSECRKIKNRQHPFIIWLCPEKDYTVDDIEIIFDRTRFALDEGQHFFIILDNAHTLTITTANRLLKVVEEPPAGYHFIFLTTNQEAIIPTILSRCIVVPLIEESTDAIDRDSHPLLQYFYQTEKRQDPMGFEAELKKQKLTDTQSIELVDRMMRRYTQQLKDCYKNNTSLTEVSIQQKLFYLEAVLACLAAAQRMPPQSGSSELFWKYLFLTMPRG